MKLLFKNVALWQGKANPELTDIEVENGVISNLGNISASADHQVFAQEGLHASAGWFDPFVNFGEPGLEHKEDLQSGINVAMRGGFTSISVLPDTDPVIDNKSQLSYIASATANTGVKVHVNASFVKHGNYHELSEMMELAEAGVMAFVQPAGQVLKSSVVLKALEYSKITRKPVVLYLTDFDLVGGAFMHEGHVNVRLGMRGIPDFTEELLVKKYTELLQYTGAAMHLSGISSAKSLPYIVAAKEKGLSLTCDVSINNLLFTDESLSSFDANYKLNPPLRSEADRQALLAAIESGLIDVVSSHHEPHEEDAKKVELSTAAFGAIGLQTLFSALLSVCSLQKAVALLSAGNKQAFHLPIPRIEVGQMADLTFFNPEAHWQFNAENNASKSENSMLLGRELQGKIMGTINHKHLFWNE